MRTNIPSHRQSSKFRMMLLLTLTIIVLFFLTNKYQSVLTCCSNIVTKGIIELIMQHFNIPSNHSNSNTRCLAFSDCFWHLGSHRICYSQNFNLISTQCYLMILPMRAIVVKLETTAASSSLILQFINVVTNYVSIICQDFC